MADGASRFLAVGALIAAAPDAMTWFAAPKVPGNMTKADTISRHLADVENARAEHCQLSPRAFADSVIPNRDKYDNAAQRPVLAVLTSVRIVSEYGDVLYAHSAPPSKHGFVRGAVAVPLINFLKEQQVAFGLPPLVGFNIKQVLRIAAFEVFRINAGLPQIERISVPTSIWLNVANAIDPLDALLPKSDQKDLDLYSLLRYLLPHSELADVPPDALMSDVVLQTRAALELAKAAQLV